MLSGEFMARDVRRRPASRQNTKRARISKRKVNRQAKKNKQKYLKGHKKKRSLRSRLFRNTGFYLDYSLMFIMIILIGIGLVMVYSSSSTTKQTLMSILKSQVLFAVVGVFLMIIEARVLDYHIFLKKGFAYSLYLFSLFLILLLLTPLAKSSHGATRWLKIAGVQFMPVEVVKIAVIVVIAYSVISLGEKINDFKSIIMIWIFYGLLPAAMIYKISNNLSSAIIIMGICFIVSFYASPNYKAFIAIVAAGFAVVVVYLTKIIMTIQSSGNFRHERVLAWLHPEQYADGKAYQTIHGLYAIGSGGLFGKGLGKSLVKLQLPEAYNDMIFTIICEELGVFGALCILLAFGVLLWRIAHVAKNAPDLFGALLCAGVFAHISLQVLINIAVVTGTIPNTGVTLPFISKGGTAILFLLFELGIVFNVSSQIKDELNE